MFIVSRANLVFKKSFKKPLTGSLDSYLIKFYEMQLRL
ncbi:hypothetical protein JCM19294_2052 [Nonlabens tegetincola]|uniref:Uncharacterized protein n=1 Tax=Nonlabens tegetincola TaxID=323273 RepID=A0A090Q0E9_9FLAO|nr:hypothetical protein JCM19294_2052 [Nonlabens tegetincola]